MTRSEYEAEQRTRLTGVLWKPLMLPGVEPIYLISEKRQIYNFIRCRILTASQGRYIRFRKNGVKHLYQLDELITLAFPELYDSPEEWRIVRIGGEDSAYEVSSSGVIRRRNNKHIVKPTIQKDGFSFIQLSRDGKIHGGLVHQFVARAFLENSHGYRFIRHKDGNRQNNAADNLEWHSRKEM